MLESITSTSLWPAAGSAWRLHHRGGSEVVCLVGPNVPGNRRPWRRLLAA